MNEKFERKIDENGCLTGIIKVEDNEFYIPLYEILEQLSLEELQALKKRIISLIIANSE